MEGQRLHRVSGLSGGGLDEEAPHLYQVCDINTVFILSTHGIGFIWSELGSSMQDNT